ncbi:hypothetical protein [Winogradskyella ludwigii]|jgi:hypothetical protein|uniref:hypothetical protein n=1 Tax=Winogradskyella ludwigii TaxID=2686076 RepID=UPI001C545411|nr:hypothetical protein [Winogradskyella ludwigii]
MGSILDTYYITILNHYKKTLGKQSLTIALLYINFLELSIVLALAAFLMGFASQMKMQLMSSTKFWVLLTIIALFVIAKNWMRYNGKKRMMLNAKSRRTDTSIYLLWILPIGCLAIASILLQVQ